jgi:uncharacterized protein (TIGR03437 family)
VLNQDGTLNTLENPAPAGTVLQIFATGLGPVDPPVSDGQTAAAEEPLNRLMGSIQVLMDGISAEVLFAGLAPGYVGLYQVNARLPAVVPSGSVTVRIQAEQRDSNTITVVVRAADAGPVRSAAPR